MKKLFLIILLGCTGLPTLSAQSNTSYTSTLKKYMEVSGTLATFKTAIKGMISNFKLMNSSVPEEVWKEFENELLNTSVDDLVKQFAPVYEKHLTEADLNDIIKFYSTPAGKKLAEKTPILTQESMAVGQAWGQAAGQKVMMKLKEKGY
jgi:hypothetical protein